MSILNSGRVSSVSDSVRPPLQLHGEESLVVDDRGQRSPSQLVEERLVQLLNRLPIAVSQTRSRSLCRQRGQFHSAAQ